MAGEKRHKSVAQALEWVRYNTCDQVFFTVHDDEDVVYTRICETGSCIGREVDYPAVFTLRQTEDGDWFWALTRQLY